MGIDAKISLTEIAKNGDGKDGVGMEIAEADFVMVNQLAQERMNRDPIPTPIVILEYYQFSRIGVWIALTR